MKNYGVRTTESFISSSSVTNSVDAVATSLQSEIVVDLDQAQFVEIQ